MNISRPGRLAVSTLSLTLIAAPALSQDGTGIRGNLSFDQRFDYSDNPDLLVFPGDSKIKSTTDLRLDIDSETRAEQFNFNIGGQAVGAFGDGATSADDLDFKNERAAISYARQGANTSLSLGANYSNFDFADEVFGFFVDGVFDPDALVIDSGQRRRTRYNFSFENGIDGPFGIELIGRLSDDEYINTVDPDLVDTKRNSLDGTARFRISPALTGRVLAGVSTTDEDDAVQTERRSSYVGVGLEGETAGGLSFTGDLTLDRAERRELGAVVSDDDGVGFEVAATQEVPDGTYGVSFTSRIDDSGRRNTANLSRDFDLPNGALSLSLGLADQENSSTEITTNIGFTREFRDASFTANVVQRPTTDDGTAFLNTSVELNYLQEINAISSWNAGFSYGAASEFGTSGSDTRTSASISYNRELTEDWNLRAGVSTTRIDASSGPNRSRNTVFLSVGRDFSFGF